MFKINNHEIEITNPDKILFPQDGITKGDIIDYYAKIARWMLPFMQDRPITMLRYPNGIEHEGFYQKDAGSYFPDWIKLQPVKHTSGITEYVVCNNAATLVYLANQAVITPHLWLSTTAKLRNPDRMIFDLDPATNKQFALIKETAKLLHQILKDLGLAAFVMSTGSRGLHVIVPLDASTHYEVVRSFARDVANVLVREDPKNYTINPRKEKRGKKILIDYLRNGFGATAVAPFAIRPKPNAPVATPLAWEELDNAQLTPQLYTINTIFDRLKKVGNVWPHFFTSKQSLISSEQMI